MTPSLPLALITTWLPFTGTPEMPPIKVGLRRECGVADANSIGLVATTDASTYIIAYIDVVTARGEILTGSIAHCDVVVAGHVVKEGITTHCDVAAASCVELERRGPSGRVADAGCVVF